MSFEEDVIPCFFLECLLSIRIVNQCLMKILFAENKETRESLGSDVGCPPIAPSHC